MTEFGFDPFIGGMDSEEKEIGDQISLLFKKLPRLRKIKGGEELKNVAEGSEKELSVSPEEKWRQFGSTWYSFKRNLPKMSYGEQISIREEVSGIKEHLSKLESNLPHDSVKFDSIPEDRMYLRKVVHDHPGLIEGWHLEKRMKPVIEAAREFRDLLVDAPCDPSGFGKGRDVNKSFSYNPVGLATILEAQISKDHKRLLLSPSGSENTREPVTLINAMLFGSDTSGHHGYGTWIEKDYVEIVAGALQRFCPHLAEPLSKVDVSKPYDALNKLHLLGFYGTGGESKR